MPHFGLVGEHEGKSLLSAGSLEGEGDGENLGEILGSLCSLRFMEKSTGGRCWKHSFHKWLPETHDTAMLLQGPAGKV